MYTHSNVAVQKKNLKTYSFYKHLLISKCLFYYEDHWVWSLSSSYLWCTILWKIGGVNFTMVGLYVIFIILIMEAVNQTWMDPKSDSNSSESLRPAMGTDQYTTWRQIYHLFGSICKNMASMLAFIFFHTMSVSITLPCAGLFLVFSRTTLAWHAIFLDLIHILSSVSSLSIR